MSEAGQRRVARQVPDRNLTEPPPADPEQLELLENDAPDVLTPEQQADEHRKQVEELQRQSQEARRQAEEATRAAQTERNQREEAQKGAFSAQEQAIASQMEAQKKLAEQARAAIKAAREVGDFDAEATALESLTDAKALLVNLSNQKTYLETIKKQAPPQQQQQQPMYRGRHGYSKASEEWIDQHPEFDNDPEFKITVLKAAQEALLAYDADSYGFFKRLDKAAAEYKNPSNGGQQQQQVRRPIPASSMAAAPARGGNQSPQSQGINDRAVAQRLGVTTDDLQSFAKIAKMKYEDYVKEQANILEEEKRGQATGLYRGEIS